jgi:hypothetical protein
VKVNVAVACGAISVVDGELEAGSGECEPEPPHAHRKQLKTTATEGPLIDAHF